MSHPVSPNTSPLARTTSLARIAAPVSRASVAIKPASATTTIDPIRVVRRHIVGIVVSAIAGAFLGTAAYLALNILYPLYSGRVLFEVRPGLQTASQVGLIDQTSDDMVFRIAQTETYMLMSDEVLDQALKNPDIKQTQWHKKFLTVSSDGREVFDNMRALDELKDDVGAGVVRSSNLFNLGWSAHVASDVPIVLNAIAKAYLENRRARDYSVYDSNLSLFDEQLTRTQRELQDLAQEMRSLIKNAQVTTLEDTKSSAQAFKVQELTRQLAEVTSALNVATTGYSLASAKLEGTMEPDASDVMEAERDPAVMDQTQVLQALKAELRRLYSMRESSDPLVLNWEKRVKSVEEERGSKIKEIIRRNLEAAVRTWSENKEKYSNVVNKLEEELERNQLLLVDLAAEQAKYEALKLRREQLEAKRTADLELINEVKLMRLRADAARITLAQWAQTPREQSFPKPQVIIPLSILVLMGVTVGLVFLREMLDQRVKSASDLAVLPGARVLGAIPDLQDDPTKTAATELVIRKHPFSVLAESYRQMASTILPMMDANGHQTLLIMGGLPGSGTTTVVSNLVSLAGSSGRKVLAIDANFRRPRLAQAMEVPADGPGLADLLSGTATVDQTVLDAGNGVSVIGAGTPANRVFDRLHNGMFDSILAELRGRFDLIVFDAPPVVVSGDALVLANKVDATVLVVRANQEHRGLVARLINRLSDSRSELLGVLLNRPRGVAGGYLKKNYAAMAEYSVNAST
jgi:succinoglycan biosynthesis transport protein ExoP